MNNLAKREKILLILGGGLIFFYLYYSIFLSPIIMSITNERKVIASKNIEVASVERLKITNVSNKKKLDEYVKKFEDAVKQLPKTDRNPEIAYNLNELATKSKITIDSVSFGANSDYVEASSKENTPVEIKPTESKVSDATASNTNTTSQKLKLVPVSITVTGDYASFLNFVSGIETIEADNRLAEIGNINISAKTEGNNVQAAMTLNYYFSEGTTKEQPTYDNLKDTNVGKDNLFN